jgi:hypothetical protein
MKNSAQQKLATILIQQAAGIEYKEEYISWMH